MVEALWKLYKIFEDKLADHEDLKGGEESSWPETGLANFRKISLMHYSPGLISDAVLLENWVQLLCYIESTMGTIEALTR